MGQAPSQPGPPGTKFRVIGAGMSRTGTKTLNEALTILLNGPVHDSGIQSIGGSMKEIRTWLAIMRLAPDAESFADKKRLDYLFASILEGYVATMDCPAAALTPEIMRVYPDAIVIATTRDAESWWRSMSYMNTMLSNWYLPLVVMWVPKAQVYGKWRMAFRKVALWRYGQERMQPNTLEKHEEHLRQVVPPEKLFWYNVKEGWGPLCKILDLPIPDKPFPHNNNQADAGKVYRLAMGTGFTMWFLVIGAVWCTIKYTSRWYNQHFP